MSSYQQDLQTDMQRLEKMLQRVVGKQDPARPSSPSEDSATRILDLACGACNEAETLTDFFSKLKNRDDEHSKKKVELLGIDVRAREIADTKPSETSQA